jgi:choline dehydrogenase
VTVLNMDFDYIIVGAGSAGCVLANKLTENGKYRVLLLEAGGTDRRFFVQMPLGYGKTFYDPSVNWLYATEPDPGLNGQSDHWPRGKVLGGSSSINAMVYIRGHRADYEAWEAAGNQGWGWDQVLPAFKAIEDNEEGANDWRGAGGPLFIRKARLDDQVLVKPFLEACALTGLPHNRDFNGASQEGAGTYQLTTKNGVRNSAARAFLRPAMKRANLHVEVHALATEVLFDGSKAIGVAYAQRGRTLKALAKREVIIAGGAVNSPQLLQLSGIGPAELLKACGVGVRSSNKNVGAHLSDHQGINYTWKLNVPTLNDVLRPWWGKLKVGLQYILTRGGPLSLSINHGGGFFRTDASLPRPNMQLYMQAFSTLLPKAGERPLLSPDPYSGFSLGLSNCTPTSTGQIDIRSADPNEKPRITANVFSTDHDVAEMLLAVKQLRAIAAQEPLRRLVVEELRPGTSVQSDMELIADFRQRSGTVYHPCCTCRMGPEKNSSVVDSRLRVHGVQGLRVCDASAFPKIIAGNLNAPAMMMGWKGAELILEDAKRQ